ncbi:MULTISPECIES: SDR family oxidoreductase [Rhizobium]|jgi:short-subunit dehydrogenase|uniref:3-dehydrosphinganine reductase n=1 Tax=Rhizobium lusitanum TaxID=293958 RepID=A0A1C3TUJ6_9HYPH|nr:MULTISPECIES: SDR family oxidoreductase [Rhizobium]NKJ07351.1 short-subunit dehydrogenase [Rhizobium sp. SG741]NTJ06674.1 SDR family oxidoreductase [Rhizobium lusitanum]SCB06923.1 Short-chain dehydrogenase [Rhizobium lusitanum]
MHVIVTGGSSGIGLAIAKLYATRGDRVSLLARHPGRLEQARAEIISLSGIDSARVQIASVDVASADQTTAAIEICEASFGPCDILIASAGIVEPRAFDAMSASIFEEQISINFLGTANAVRSVYRGMKARRSGRIMMISSGAALVGIFGYTAYCASKSALVGFAEALSAEAEAFGVRISICFPPDTLTPQYRREISMRPAEAKILMGSVKPWSAEAVAARIVRGLEQGKAKIHFGFSLAALAYFGPLIKPPLMWFISRKTRKIIGQEATESLADVTDRGFDHGK